MGCVSHKLSKIKNSGCEKITWHSYLEKDAESIQISVNSVKKMVALNTPGNQNFLLDDFSIEKNKK